MYYTQLVKNRIWHILTLGVVVSILAVIVVESMTPVYKSSTVLLLEPEQAQTISLADLFYVDTRGSAYVNTQIEIISSRRLLEKLVDELQMQQPPTVEDASWIRSLFKLQKAEKVSDEEAKEALIDSIRENLKITEIPQSQLIELSVESNTPKMAAAIANTLSRIYIQDTLDSRMEMARQASSWMRERANSLKEKLTIAENNLQAFIEAEGLVNMGEGVTSLTSQQLTEQSNRAITARAKVVELSQRYGPKHPILIAAKKELAEAERAMQSGKSTIRSLGRTDVKLKELQHEVDSTRELYNTYVSRVKETEESSTLRTATARMIDEAVEPRYPIKPKKKMIVIAVFFLTLAAGVLLVFLQEMLDSTIRTVEQVGSKLGLPLLGMLPLVKFKKKVVSREEALREELGGGNEQFNESIRTIRTGIMLSAIDKPHKVIVVTSSVPGEGKSTVATNLAVAMGKMKMEKVLLIDADMRRPTIRKHIGKQLKPMGLSELVAGTAEFKEAITRDSEFGIDVMHAGAIPPNPQELISSKRFATVIDALKNHYDRVIIDSTPIHAVSDALILSQHASGMVYVVKADSTSEYLIKGCLKRLREINASIIGVVLNQVDVSKSSGYEYSGYYNHYGYATGDEKAKG